MECHVQCLVTDMGRNGDVLCTVMLFVVFHSLPLEIFVCFYSLWHGCTVGVCVLYIHMCFLWYGILESSGREG